MEGVGPPKCRVYGGKSVTGGALHPHKMQSISPIDEPQEITKYNVHYKRLTSVWGTCARTEAGVLMYLSKQSDDQRPKTLISHGGKLAEAAVVAAPMRKLWPANSLEFSPPFESKSLVSLANFSRVRNEPDS